MCVMAYDEGVAERVRVVLDMDDFETKKMFGGLAFLLLSPVW